MLDTNQFQSSCIGQARISDHTINSMVTKCISVKVRIDFVAKFVLIFPLFYTSIPRYSDGLFFLRSIRQRWALSS